MLAESAAAGAGAGAAIKKDQDAEVSETFTQPLQRTKSAVLAALKRMRVEISSSEGERITGNTKEHPVEAEEVIDQTKRALGEGAS